MNDTEATKTILQMVRFIKQEAEEKANEIMIAAEEEFNITKLQLLEAEKAKVRHDFERRISATEVKKKVEFSKQLNESRLKVLQAQDDAIRAIKGDAQVRLGALSQNESAYRHLMQSLLVEAMHKLGEPKAKVRCRQSDSALLKSILPQAHSLYTQRYGRDAPEVTLDESHFLPPGGNSDSEFDTCAGGLVITSADGRIVCSNTLDDRLSHAFNGNLPAIRQVLFAV